MYPRIIGLTGYKGSGKDEAAKALTGQHGPYQRYALAGPVKQICEIAFGLTWEEMEGNRELKEKAVDRYPFFSPRKLMQQVGTDMFRTHYPDIWIEAMKRHMTRNATRQFVVTDVRFPNEADAIRDLEGLLVRVTRTDQPENIDPHPSERYIGMIKADHEILAATGEIESLHKQIRILVGLHTELNRGDF